MRNKRPYNREHPHTVEENVPPHYNNMDVPHVLALLRTFDRFFDDIVEKDEQLNEHYNDLYDAYMTMMERELEPYAFDFAVSLIRLEDELAKQNADVRPAYRATDAHPHLTFVPLVTRQHGEQFAAWWGEASHKSGALTEASAEAGIMTRPDDEHGATRYHAIENEIARRVFDELRSTIVTTYVRIANDILNRERDA
jgi:hypothetical protein